ncbi:MAG: glycosyltransferase [Paludibacteraceae bacterium]|nr:glycosyltransferase [Paludibacteraceae bacterium]
MKILVLTDPYSPPAFAPRLRYFCEYWCKVGHSVYVLTERFKPIPFPHSYPIQEIPLYRNRTDWFLKSAWSLLTDWKNRFFARKAQEAVKDLSFDLVFCTTFSTFPLRAALDIAREKRIPLHVDIRDVDEQVPNAQYQHHRQWWARPFRKWYRQINIRRRNRVLRLANTITTISPWHVDFLRTLNTNVHLLYNGFDPEQFYFAPVHHNEFLISYIGTIYEFQHPEVLFAMIRQLQAQLPLLRLNLHTPNHQPIAITEVGEEIRKSSIMLVLTSPSAKGMMTTKFFDALGCEKPVLCYPSDQGLLAQAIEDTNAGLASDDMEGIRTFIIDKYREWEQNGFTRQPVHQALRQRFSRLYQAEQMETILQRLL